MDFLRDIIGIFTDTRQGNGEEEEAKKEEGTKEEENGGGKHGQISVLR